MVRFGAKKEEFIPPFLFSAQSSSKKSAANAALFNIKDHSYFLDIGQVTLVDFLPIDDIEESSDVVRSTILVV